MFDIVEPVWTPALPHPVTSLTFGLEMTTTDPVRIQDTKVRLSVSDNAEDFLLYGGLTRVGRRTLLEVETILGGNLAGNCDSSESTLLGVLWMCYWKYQVGYISLTWKSAVGMNASSRP